MSIKFVTFLMTHCSSRKYEEMLTRFVCLGNCMIVNSATRRGPYWHLLELCLHTSHYTTHIEAVLRGVATRLGFAEFSSLFEAYAGQIAFSIRQAGNDFLLFSPHVLGYKDRRQCAEATFSAFSPQNLLSFGTSAETAANGRRLFRSHCAAIQKTIAEGWRLCFADVVGNQIVAHVAGRSSKDSRVFSAFLEDVAGEIGLAKDDTRDLLRQHADGITVAIVRTLADQDVSASGPIATQLTLRSSAARDTFCSLTTYRGQDSFRTHEPDFPRAPTAVVLAALTWFYREADVEDGPALSYHVVRILFAELEHTYVVNERIRRLNCVCLWVALHEEHFEESTLLRTLSRSVANLFAQYDLIRGAQSILQWILSRTVEDIGLAELLIRVACAAYEMSLSSVREFSVAGLDVLEWLEEETIKLVKSAGMRAAVQQALVAWPRELNGRLQSISQAPNADDVARILVDKRISSNKFRLVSQLRRLAGSHQYGSGQFAKSDFWQLKESIPPASRLADDDISSFIQLLLLYVGDFNGLTHDSQPQETALLVHLDAPVSNANGGTPNYALSARRAIMTLLLKNLDAASPIKANIAFVTLCSIASVDLAGDRPRGGTQQYWSPLQRHHLRLIQEFPRPTFATVVHIADAFAWETRPELVQDYPRWVRYVATTLGDHLSGFDTFYASLHSVLQTDAVVAGDILPILVHSALAEERRQVQRRDVPSGEALTVSAVLSQYFSHVLSCSDSSTACRFAIISTVLHLRQVTLRKDADPLGHDKWLRIDFLLLSRNAIMCGSYTTALLFLELAKEYSHRDQLDALAVEQVLYDIYTHIDEPDGFYGIETQELDRFLLKSFHHEGRWDKAFQFHGAALETGQSTAAETEGMLMALHSIGFDRLALTTLQRSDLFADAPEGGSLAYQLGWRTAAWDLPERSEDGGTGAAVYTALKAVNRERDLGQVYQCTRRGLEREMQVLRTLGNENLKGILDVTRSLMCLDQVRLWIQPDLQQRIRERSVSRTPASTFEIGIDDMA